MTEEDTKDRREMMKNSVKKTPNLPGKQETSNGAMKEVVAHKTIGLLKLPKMITKILKKDGVLALKLRIQRNQVKKKVLEMLAKVPVVDGAMKPTEIANHNMMEVVAGEQNEE